MKAEELRIGNIINRPDLGDGHLRSESILAIYERIKTTGPVPTILDFKDIQPISLTEEWLLTFGAKKSYENWQYTISVGAISLHLRCNTEWYSELGGIYLGSKIQYVHQLQNLYFALTGDELSLNTGIK